MPCRFPLLSLMCDALLCITSGHGICLADAAIVQRSIVFLRWISIDVRFLDYFSRVEQTILGEVSFVQPKTTISYPRKKGLDFKFGL